MTDVTDAQRDLALYMRAAVKVFDQFSFKWMAQATLSLRTINSRLLQLDQEGEAAVERAEIRHNMVLLKSGIRLGIIEGAKAA